MSDNVDIEGKVKEIIIDRFSCDPETITAESNFIDDLGADSLDVVELVMTMEDEFKVEIPDEMASQMKTVQDAVDFIKKRQVL